MMILTARTHNSATIYHLDNAAKSVRKVFCLEIDFALVTH